MGPSETTDPSETFGFGGHGVCEGSEDEGQGLPSRLTRYGTARTRARQMLTFLRELPDQAERERSACCRLADCGEYLRFAHYYTVGKVRLTAARFCMQSLLCPLCAIRRASKAMGAYLDRYRVIRQEQPQLRPYLVTLTVRNGSDLGERVGHLTRCHRRLLDHRRDWLKKGWGWTEAAHAAGGVWSIETTNRGAGWHPHMHAIWLCEQAPDQQALRDEWELITGDSFMVDVRPIEQAEDPAGGFLEVFKYALKFGDLALPDNVTAWRTLSGRRLLGSFGVFRGVEVPESLTDEPLDDLPYLELLYRYLPGIGYSLTVARQVGFDAAARNGPAGRAVRASDERSERESEAALLTGRQLPVLDIHTIPETEASRRSRRSAAA